MSRWGGTGGFFEGGSGGLELPFRRLNGPGMARIQYLAGHWVGGVPRWAAFGYD